jgi:hypothetical protein
MAKKQSKTAYLWVALVVVGALAVVTISKAFMGNAQRVIENVEVYNEAADVAQAPQGDQNLGAITSPDFTSLYFSVNGDTRYSIVAPFIDASTTIVSFANPFGITSTSTVEMVRLNLTGSATTSLTAICGASANAYLDNTYFGLVSGEVPTSTPAGTIENGIANSYGNVTGGSVQKFLLTPSYPYLVCKATSTSGSTYNTGITNVGNTFDGKATVRISQTR